MLGIRPETFEDVAFAQPGQPTIDVELTVVEELGSDDNLLFPVNAPRISAESLQARTEDATLLADVDSLFTARVDPRTHARAGGRLTLAVDPARFHFFDPETGESLHAAPQATDGERVRGGRTAMTKQSEARTQVLDLIDRLGVGEAIPSERKLTVDLGMSRLTVRAALDELVREGYLVRRRGAGTFVSEPKIAQELTMTSFTDDMRRRGLVPASRTLELNDCQRGSATWPPAARLTIGAGRRREEAPARRPRDDGDRGSPRPRVAGAESDGGRPRVRLVLRAARRIATGSTSSAASRPWSRR